MLDTKDKYSTDFARSIRRSTRLGLLSAAVLVFGFGAWAMTARLSSALVTSGQIVVSSYLKVVQHPDGGVVGEVLVADGDRVATGDVLLRLDDTLLKASRALLADQLFALKARLARLRAERDGSTEMHLEGNFTHHDHEPREVQAIDAEHRVLLARAETAAGQIATFSGRKAQIEEQIRGLEAQRAAKMEETDLIGHELAGLEKLFANGHAPQTRLTALRRERTKLLGETGSLTSQIAVAKGQISEMDLRIIQINTDRLETAVSEIAAIEPEIAALEERLVATDRQLSRLDIRAPYDGVVHQLAVHTVGGVIQPAEIIMSIVPDADSLVIEAQVLPSDISSVYVGQDAEIVITAFDPRNTPRFNGTLEFVSADLNTDPNTGLGYFGARISLKEEDLGKLDDLNLAMLPGMQAEVYIATGEQTLAQYLIRPLEKQVRQTFRET